MGTEKNDNVDKACYIVFIVYTIICYIQNLTSRVEKLKNPYKIVVNFHGK